MAARADIPIRRAAVRARDVDRLHLQHLAAVGRRPHRHREPIQPSTGPSPSAATTVKLVPAAHQLPAPVQRAVAVNNGKRSCRRGLDANGTSTSGVFAYSPQTGKIAQVGSVPQAFHDAAGKIGKDLLVRRPVNRELRRGPVVRSLDR